MYKIPIHSIVDVITNSSTVIYTYQNSIKEAKELLREILNLMGVEKTVDDLFYINTFLEDTYHYEDYLNDNAEYYDYDITWSDETKSKFINNIIKRVLRNEIARPEWMVNCDESENYDGYSYDTCLYIDCVDDTYKPLIDKILKFLSSPSHEGSYNG